MNTYKAILDTRRPNGVIATITQFDNATLALQVMTNGEIERPWEAPHFELIAMKRDHQAVREVDQAAFTIEDAGEHRVTVELKEQFLTCRGSVKMQLVVKDGDRLSTSVFYVMVGESLDHGIIESHRDVAVLDELEQYVKTGYDDLAYQEQRMKDVEKATHALNELMVGNEAGRQEAESKRQALFEGNEGQRQDTFNQQLTSQRREFEDSQADREDAFNDLKQNMSSEFNAAQNEREREFDTMMSSNQAQFNHAESARATTFSNRQIENERVFTANENARQTVFNANEAGRKTNETDRVANENTRKNNETGRVAAETQRQQKMSEFEAKATQLSNELDAQVERVGAFVSANEEKLLGDRDKVDYMGNTHESVKAASDANVDWLLGEVNTAHYEGQHITANDTIEGRAKSAILTGCTLVNINSRVLNNGKINPIYYPVSQVNTKNIKTSTKYLVVVYNDGDSDIEVYLNGNCFEWNSFIVKSKNMNKAIGTTKAEIKDDIWLSNSVAQTTEQNIRTMLIEYQEGMENWDIPYFEGMQSVKMPALKTTGKNTLNPNEITFDSSSAVNPESYTYSEGVYTFKNSRSNNQMRFTITKQNASDKILYEVLEVKDLNGNVTPHQMAMESSDDKKYWFSIVRPDWGNVGEVKIKLGVDSLEPYKSNILTVNEDVTLRSNGDICDELNLLTGQLTQRIDENGEVLSQEIVKTVDLSDNHVYSYKDVTHYDCSSADGSLVPTLSIDVPTNLPAVVTRQRATIQELEKENAALKNEIEETANSSVNGDLELMSSQFELDFRLFEIEMNLDMPMMATMRGVKSMAMTVYQQAKTLILAGKYEREDMEYKLNRYKAAGRITVEEYEELIALMDARELVD